MWKNDNDYSIIIFDSDNHQIAKMQYVNDLYEASKWLDGSKYSDWHYFNAYNRRSKMFLKRYYKGSYIPRKPRF